MSSAPASSPYDPFAEIYDLWMAEDFCRRAWPVLERLFTSQLPRGAHVLDLCCGSGQMARALTAQGFRVTGLDISQEMLRLARRNAPSAEFVLADARCFALPRQHHGAISTFNSLAHLETADDLRSAFGSVRAALAPNAPFLFDTSTEEAYTAKWRGSFRYQGANCECTVEPGYDTHRRIGRNRVTLICSDQRRQFCIQQTCHSEEDIRAALANSGFTSLKAFDAEYDLGMEGEQGRAFFLCS